MLKLLYNFCVNNDNVHLVTEQNNVNTATVKQSKHKKKSVS